MKYTKKEIVDKIYKIFRIEKVAKEMSKSFKDDNGNNRTIIGSVIYLMKTHKLLTIGLIIGMNIIPLCYFIFGTVYLYAVLTTSYVTQKKIHDKREQANSYHQDSAILDKVDEQKEKHHEIQYNNSFPKDKEENPKVKVLTHYKKRN